MKLVPGKDAWRIPKNKVFVVTLRMLRMNRSKVVGSFIAKSRLLVLGHMDPQLGEFRTDAPAAAPVAIQLIRITAASLKWTGMVFDVKTAFLSWKACERKLDVRAPRDGLHRAARREQLPHWPCSRS